MLKTIKGKVIAGTVALALVSGTGAAFANSIDAGQKLQNWYTAKFLVSSASIYTQVNNHGNTEKGKFDAEYATMKTDATTSINNKADSMETSTNENVKAASDAYIKAVTDKKALLSSNMERQFDNLSFLGTGIINAAGTKAVKDARTELDELTSQTGGTATEKMTEEINEATKKAKDDLQAAITAAKNQLQAELNEETSDTVDELNKKIDAKIVEIRGTITEIKNGFVATQEQKIADAATALETQAKLDLDKIVSDFK